MDSARGVAAIVVCCRNSSCNSSCDATARNGRRTIALFLLLRVQEFVRNRLCEGMFRTCFECGRRGQVLQSHPLSISPLLQTPERYFLGLLPERKIPHPHIGSRKGTLRESDIKFVKRPLDGWPSRVSLGPRTPGGWCPGQKMPFSPGVCRGFLLSSCAFVFPEYNLHSMICLHPPAKTLQK